MDEFSVKTASSVRGKKYNVFKLHKDDNVTWTEAKMRRETDYQPWQIKFGSGRTGRRFKAVKEGGVGDNASYFIFYKPNDKADTYEVCSVDEWYSVSATQRYKTLTAEEAEQKFEQRHKMLNLFSVMHKKNGEAGEEGGSGHGGKAFKVSELDDWDQSGNDEASENDDDSDDDKKKVRRKKGSKKDTDDPDNAPDEAKEDSDEGDAEQREVDYMSDSSSDSSDEEERKDETEVKGIAEEEALRDLLSTDDEEEAENVLQKGYKSANSKATLSTVDIKRDPEESDDSSDSDDYDVDEEKMDSMFFKKGLPTNFTGIKQEVKQEVDPPVATSSSNSRQQANLGKRKLSPEVAAPLPQPPKRPCTTETSTSPANGQERIVEDLIRKYLSRKPMTLKTLLKDIKSRLKRMEGVTPGMDNDLVNTIASIMKRLDIDKQKINDVTYFSLKP